MKPELPIDVDENTGVWQTDGLPMIYVPRHFFVNNHRAIEEEIGLERYSEILYKPGYKSAYYWCDQESKTHGLKGMDVYKHYLKRLSQRGWGLMGFIDGKDDISTGVLEISLKNSVFVKHSQKFDLKGEGDEYLCYMFNGWFAGAADWVAEQENVPTGFVSEQVECEVNDGSDQGLFVVKRK